MAAMNGNYRILLERGVLIQVPGCWKAVLINRLSPVEKKLLS